MRHSCEPAKTPFYLSRTPLWILLEDCYLDVLEFAGFGTRVIGFPLVCAVLEVGPWIRRVFLEFVMAGCRLGNLDGYVD